MKYLLIITIVLTVNLLLISCSKPTSTDNEFVYDISVPEDYPTIQMAIDSSKTGDIILIQPGTYIENLQFDEKNLTVCSNFLPTGDTLYISNTIIDGDSSGSVISIENVETSINLNGFTIMNGTGTFTIFRYKGGGIYCNNSNIVLKNLKIIDNSVAGFGAGIYCLNSEMKLSDVSISNNYNTENDNYGGSGGGIFCENSVVDLNSVIVDNNYSYYGGGGIQCGFSTMNIINSTIKENRCRDDGAGISCCFSNLFCFNTKILDNRAFTNGSIGGGIELYESNSFFENVNISGNYSGSIGGGIGCFGSFLTLQNVIVDSNSADFFGGGILCSSKVGLIVKAVMKFG